MLRNRACRAKIASGKLVADFSLPRFDVVKAEVAHLGTPLLGKPLKDSGRTHQRDASITATGKRRQRAIDGRTTRHQGLRLVAIMSGDDRMHLRLQRPHLIVLTHTRL